MTKTSPAPLPAKARGVIESILAQMDAAEAEAQEILRRTGGQAKLACYRRSAEFTSVHFRLRDFLRIFGGEETT